MPSSRPATQLSRSTPTSPRPAGRATAPPAASPILPTPTCSPISCAPTGTASAPSRPSRTTSAHCAPWVRGRDDLVATRIALANQLRSTLEGFWPGAAAIFADVASPIALAFIRRYPTPGSAARLGSKRLAGFLAAHSYSGRRSPDELVARLRAAPQGLAGDTEAEAKGELVRSLASTLDALVTEIARLSARIEHDIAQLPDGQIVMSFPHTGRICAARILAELGNVRDRFPTEDQLAAEAGVCPVTHASGKSRGVVLR